MPEQNSDTPDKSFADFLGQLVEGKAEGLSEDVRHFGAQLTALRDKHKEIIQAINQGESQTAQLKANALKLEGSLEALASVIRRSWESNRPQEPEVLKKSP